MLGSRVSELGVDLCRGWRAGQGSDLVGPTLPSLAQAFLTNKGWPWGEMLRIQALVVLKSHGLPF